MSPLVSSGPKIEFKPSPARKNVHRSPKASLISFTFGWLCCSPSSEHNILLCHSVSSRVPSPLIGVMIIAVRVEHLPCTKWCPVQSTLCSSFHLPHNLLNSGAGSLPACALCLEGKWHPTHRVNIKEIHFTSSGERERGGGRKMKDNSKYCGWSAWHSTPAPVCSQGEQESAAVLVFQASCTGSTWLAEGDYRA